MQFDIWKFPTGPDPVDNVRQAVRITHQTGQVQTPEFGPHRSRNGLSLGQWRPRKFMDSESASGETRQITFEKDPRVVAGVPIWSPDGKSIAFAINEPAAGIGRSIRYWLIRPDGSDLHVVLSMGTWAAWSGDSQWLYYCESSPVQETGSFRLMKVSVSGGTPVLVRSDNARGPAVAPDGSALYYVVPLQNLNGSLDYELRAARPENGSVHSVCPHFR